MAKMNFFEKLVVNSWWDKAFHKYFGIARLLENVPNENFGSILEIGAGTGITTSFIQQKFPNALIVATDYDPEQVNEARKRLANSGMVIQQADATKLTFADNSFGACFAILVFHHIENFPEAISEIFRILKPGGKFFVLDIQAKAWSLFHLRSHRSPGAAPGLFSKEEFERMVQKTGFRSIQTSGNWIFWLIGQKP